MSRCQKIKSLFSVFSFLISIFAFISTFFFTIFTIYVPFVSFSFDFNIYQSIQNQNETTESFFSNFISENITSNFLSNMDIVLPVVGYFLVVIFLIAIIIFSAIGLFSSKVLFSNLLACVISAILLAVSGFYINSWHMTISDQLTEILIDYLGPLSNLLFSFIDLSSLFEINLGFAYWSTLISFLLLIVTTLFLHSSYKKKKISD